MRILDTECRTLTLSEHQTADLQSKTRYTRQTTNLGAVWKGLMLWWARPPTVHHKPSKYIRYLDDFFFFVVANLLSAHTSTQVPTY